LKRASESKWTEGQPKNSHERSGKKRNREDKRREREREREREWKISRRRVQLVHVEWTFMFKVKKSEKSESSEEVANEMRDFHDNLRHFEAETI
jgi:hypothetical protein